MADRSGIKDSPNMSLQPLQEKQILAMSPSPTPVELPYNNSPEIIGITGSFFALALFIVLLRCYVRIAMLKVFGKGTTYVSARTDSSC